MNSGGAYGREVILDVTAASSSSFTRRRIEEFLVDLCGQLRLERADLHFWDYDDPAERDAAPSHLRGVSAVQFVTTSTVVVHTLDDSRQVLINVFGCGEVDSAVVERVAVGHFGGRVASVHSIGRGHA